MGLYIPELSIPSANTVWIVVSSDGHVQFDANDGLGWQDAAQPAVNIPPHGRLIDADAFVNKHFGHEYLSKAMIATREEMGIALVNIPLVINNAPTVIPAEAGKDKNKEVINKWESLKS